MLRKIAAIAITAMMTTNLAYGAVITGFDIPQTGPSFTTVAPIGGGAPEVSATSLAYTPNLTGPGFSNHFYVRGWENAINPAKYYSTTLTVDPGFVLNLDDLTYSIEDLGGAPVSTWHVRSSLDGFSSDIDSFILSNSSGLVVDRTSDLTSLGAITGAIEFRFYATTNSLGRAVGFANHLPGGAGGGLNDVGQNIRFNGTVAPAVVPEPASLAVWTAVAGLGLLSRRRRRRSAN